ncbi:MAG: hypothetical protein GX575_08250 [Candidatus Anammoximicrobium sp.]|nr:hypothetical protein [Candidatus Anammoximicrobium sp.]
MELFTITCTTCQQRLKVRDAATIGEIQICPKCGSMVLVEPPEGWREANADEVPASSLPPAPPLPAASTEPEPECNPPLAAPLPPADGVSRPPDVPLLAEREASAANLDTGIESPPVEPVAAPPLAGEYPAAPPPWATGEEAAPAASQRQQWLMLGAAAVAGVTLALGVLGFFALRAAGPNSETAGVAASAPGDAARLQTPAAEPLATGAKPAPAAKPATEMPKAADIPVADAAAASQPADQPADSPPTQNPGAAETKPAETQPAETQPAETQSAETKPAEAESGAQESGPKPVKDDKRPTETAALSETLNAFAPFIDPNLNAAPMKSLEAAAQDSPSSEPEPITTEQPAAPRPEPRQVDLPARLQDKIAEVEFADVPLEAFLRFVMNFSTIPITLDLDALALVRATPRTKVSVRKSEITVDQLLTAVLGPLQLAHVVRDQQLVVTRPPPPDGVWRTHAHAVSDLVGGDPQQLQQLADLIVDTIAPATWQAAGGPGVMREQMPALVIQQQDTVLFRTIVFCERLRAARGLPPQSKFDPELFSLTPRWARAASRLSRPVTLNFLQPASFVRILGRLSEESGVELVVDWQALATLGWTPDTETTLAVNQRPVGEVLTQLLQPMDLTYRVVDAATVQVTSPAALDACWDVEFYPVAKLPSPGETPEEFVARVRRELSGGEPDRLAGVLHFDAPSRHLIAALPQPQQRKLAELLNGGK